MSERTFHTVTLGCKLNQFDSAAIEGELSRRGYSPVADVGRAGVVVLNTCTVTGKADSEARKIIRSVRRSNARCRLIVTGCYAEREAEALRTLPGVDRVFGNRDKWRLGSILDEMGIDRGVHTGDAVDLGFRAGGDRGCEAPAALPESVFYGERSRAFLKVQEGCNLTCS
jgi:threonylcarbamoyladenosine tRNA methylthiotransferase MtaB